MPKLDIESILIIGAGPIVIGQACEFDYSGTQACKVLKEEGYKIILINSNPATIMTDTIMADSTYIEPITAEFVEKIIEKEKPDAILPTVGGQTALNCALELWKNGVLKKHNIKLLGASPEAIEKAEDRRKFNVAMAKIGLDVPKNTIVGSIQEAQKALDFIGLPAIIRPSFTMGGAGGGIAKTKEEFLEIVAYGLDLSPSNEVLIDESLIGWKEYEMEVVRDQKDNTIIVCSIENVDPLGVHTGDSITVAPALTLTDKEYQIMRNASIAVLREIGVDTGGSNVQFAVNPKNGKLVVIEMNPRVSRSSALASKATGFPIAKVAALLAVGYSLDEIKNDITKVTPASFEPSIDYVVTKIPRFTFEKFNESTPILSSTMRSVGEAMSIGRSFAQSIQKALYSMETGLTGFNEPEIEGLDSNNSLQKNQEIIKESISTLSHNRILKIAHALRYDITVKEICEITSYDKWYVDQIKIIIDEEQKITENGLPTDKYQLLQLKKLGFCDERLSELSTMPLNKIRALRKELNIKPVFKRVDTCSAEFKSHTPYMYSSYEGDGINEPHCESNPTDKEKIIILGGGPNRIGQGIEFDYACVHAAFSLSDAGYETIMVNCNPETVSTDYDTSDRLYFEPLSSEHVLEIIYKEQQNGTLKGVIVQFGGQTALKLAKTLDEEGISIIGTPYDKIDLAEDRERFQQLLNEIDLIQPNNLICHKLNQIKKTVEEIGYPVVIRPSNVLGGRGMEIVYNQEGLDKYVKVNKKFILNGPILIDHFLSNAIEIDVDALCDGEDVYVAGIMEHIEAAGIHSGDSSCSLPPYSLSQANIDQVTQATIKLAKSIGVIGLMNVQYAIKEDVLYIIEVNPRASRTLPFVAKATGVNIAKYASLIMAGSKLKDFNLKDPKNDYFSVKEVVFPFARFANVDILLGPEMKSTGEVMGIDKEFKKAFIKAQLAAGNKLVTTGSILISIANRDKNSILLNLAKELQKNNFNIYATKGTTDFLQENGINNVTTVNKVKEGGYDVVQLINDKKLDCVINTTVGARSIEDSFSLRRAVLINRISYFTTLESAKCFVSSLEQLKQQSKLEVVRMQDV